MSGPRYELPPGLDPEEERAVLAALEQAMEAGRERPSLWVAAGRADNLRRGALQLRRQTADGWRFPHRVPFARRGTTTLQGRGDAR